MKKTILSIVLTILTSAVLLFMLSIMDIGLKDTCSVIGSWFEKPEKTEQVIYIESENPVKIVVNY